MSTKELEEIFEELVSVYHDLKAEVIVSELLKNSSMAKDEFVVHTKSTFSRPHRRDIIDIGNTDDGILNLNLSRNGLYDRLPEGLFHSQDTSKGERDYASLRKKYKLEEQEARHFFAPFENEFFLQKLNNTINEEVLINDFLNLSDDFLIKFWNIGKNIPSKYVIKLIKLLPFSYKIAGDLELTKLCLENILNKKVTIRRKNVLKKTRQNRKEKSFSTLGENFTLSETSDSIYASLLEIEIGLIEENTIDDYTKKDGILNFINVFCDYFMPLEFEIKTHLLINNKTGFTLNNEREPIMGLTTQI
ncbi:hypothetical protein [Hyunsoonleella rubra]|uniref:Type VI secretion system baseplate subunit TssG n=1 Tax=Hyunsoonleella rubra TaxID=1737062 RepID=A0ABW5TAL3_9FLAO